MMCDGAKCSEKQGLTRACRPEPMKLSAASDPTNHISAPIQITSSLTICARQQRGAVGDLIHSAASPLEQL